MLNRRNRLITSDDFRVVLRRGRKTPTTGGVIAVLVTPDNHPARFGCVVSKAVGNAVVRNRVKRKLRAAAATVLARTTGVDVVVRASGESVDVSVSQWEGALSRAIEAGVG